MCIIAAKPAGVRMPDNSILRNMWDVNSDGAGFMYVENGAVKIEKGFMKYKKFITALENVGNRLDLTKTPVVMHFRINTHGGIRPENTHPFPITESVGTVKKLRSTTDVGVAHNGVIPITPRKDISDTMEYVVSQLAPLKKALPRFFENKHAMQLIANAIDSKMAFLTREGKIYTIGEFNESNGVLYSNYSYEKWYSRYTGYKYYGAGWYDDEYEPLYPCVTDTDTTKDADINDILSSERWTRVSYLKEGDYVKNTHGELFDGYDFCLDENNNVFIYDFKTDSVIPMPDYDAYTASGGFAVFDDEYSEMMPVMPVSYASK